MTTSIRYEIDTDRIAQLTLNRPAARNALNWEMMEAFASAIEQLTLDTDVGSLIIAAEGQTFCAGGDLLELHNFTSRADGERLARLMGDALDSLAELPFPVIGAIEGAAIGGGAEIALACDLCVIASNARIGFPQISLALTPAWGAVHRLLNVVGYARSFELLMSGRLMESQEAMDLGLTQKVVPEGQALIAARALAVEWKTQDHAALRGLKRLLKDGVRQDPLANKRARSIFAELWAAEAHVAASAQFVKRGRQ